MSLNAYSAILTPDPWLRIIVLTSGRLLCAAGVVMILTLDVGPALRGAGALGWLGLGYFELRRTIRGYSYCVAIRVRCGGQIEVQNADHEWVPGVLQSGSLVLRKIAWLRVRSGGGPPCSELLRGDARTSHDWRRLQVIWRHIGA
jgi:hypothetical protein